MTKLEVLIPAKGNLPWLRESLKSLAKQTRPADIVTIIDDGILDKRNCEIIGREELNHKFRIIQNSGQGISAALNTAIQQSNAEFLARMDADDISHPQRFELQLKELEATDNLAGCGSQVFYINDKGRKLGTSNMPESWDTIREKIQFSTCFVHPSMTFKRLVLSQFQYRSQFDGAEDLDLFLRISGQENKLINLSQPLLSYRYHVSQASFEHRSRQTALQELAWRINHIRRKMGYDPVNNDPSLADKFVRWRLSQQGFTSARNALTMLRYGSTYLKGYDFNNGLSCIFSGTRLLMSDWHGLVYAHKLVYHGIKILQEEQSPFEKLSVHT